MVFTTFVLAHAVLAAPLAAQHPSGTAPFEPKIEPASDEPAAVAQTFEKPADFQVECFAAEPSIAQPVSFWMATDGAVYVTETFRHHAGVTDIRDHMDWLDDDLRIRSVEDRVAMYRKHLGDKFGTYETEHERIRVLRDTDGDGKADWDRVFADGFADAAAGIGAGVLERDGVVWFTCIPNLWRLMDEDRDGVSDRREQVSTGWGLRVALLGHDMHGLCIGPDGRLYWSIGDRGYAVNSFGGVRLENPFTGGVFRSNLDGSNLELFATGLRNPQELAFDDYGDLWTGDNNSDGGDLARWVLVVQHGDTGWRQAYQWLNDPNLRGAWNDEKLWEPHFDGQAAYIVPPVANVANGPSGLACYPGTGMPDRYTGHFFLCNFSGAPEWSGIYDVSVTPKGSGYSVANVERFVWRPLATDCDFGFDGGLYVSDWVAGWNKTGKGRLWRFFEPTSAALPIVAETKALLRDGMKSRKATELARLLGHADRRVRQEAHLELGARAARRTLQLDDEQIEATRALETVAWDKAAPLLARLHAIWGLGVARNASGLLPKLLSDPNDEVRAQAARTIGDWSLGQYFAAERIVPLLADPSPRVRRFAATALANVRPVVEPVRNDNGFTIPTVGFNETLHLIRETGQSDPWLRNAAISALRNVAHCAVGTNAGVNLLLDLAKDPNVDVRVAAVVALRRSGSASVEKFLADDDLRVRAEAARAVYDLSLESAFPKLAALLPKSGQAPNAIARRALHAAYRLGGQERARGLGDLAADTSARENLRREALELLARWGNPTGRDGFDGEYREHEPRTADFVPDIARDLGARGLADAPSDVARAWVRLVEKVDAQDLAPTLTAIARDTSRDAKLRADALHALGVLRPTDLLDTLRGQVFDADSAVRAMTIQVFQDVAPDEALPLLENALTASVAERRVAYAGFARWKTTQAQGLLVRELTKLEAGLVPAEVALDLVIASERRDAPELKALLDARAARRATDPELAKYVDSTYGGDVERGRDIFRNKGQLECLRCHAVASEGGIVGPALDGIGTRRSRFELLESLCAPNRTFSPGFQGSIVFPKDDAPVEGLIIEDTPERVVVRKADGVQVEFARADIEGTKPGLSAMPSNLTDHISREEMRDLIEYLATLPAAQAQSSSTPTDSAPTKSQR